MQKPLIPLQLYVAWNKVVRYFNQKSCALHNCVFYKLWELPRSLRRCMKRSVTFPRLGHLTSACITKSEYALWNSHKWTKLFVALACNNNIDCSWLRNPSSLSSPPLSLLRSCSWCEMENMRILSSEDYLWAKQSVPFLPWMEPHRWSWKPALSWWFCLVNEKSQRRVSLVSGLVC